MTAFGLILGGVLFAAAIYYFIVGFFPESATSQRIRSRLEFTADVRRAKGYSPNTPALYAWMLRTKLRVGVLVAFLLFWAVWFASAPVRS